MTRSRRILVSARHWPVAVDGLLDGAVVMLAIWTIWYEVALVAQFDLRPWGWPLVISAVLVTGWFAVRAVRVELAVEEGESIDAVAVSGRAGQGGPAERQSNARPARSVGGVDLAWIIGLALLVLAVLRRESMGVLPAAAIGIALVAVAAWQRILRPGAERATDVTPSVGNVQHAIAGVVSVGLAVLSLFIVKFDADDAYYVNRAAWVAGHGTAALNDTMFSPDKLSRPAGMGLPTPSIEALQGVLAHLLGIEVGTFVYLVAAPGLAAATGWVTWRLVRAWAPRRQVLVLLVAVLFVLASGPSIVGNYSIGRIWQGKVTAYAVLLPLVWLYLTRIGKRLDRQNAVVLAAAGVAFVGLTTTSALMAPVMLGAALVAGLLARSKGVAIGGLLFGAAPLVNGVVQILAPAPAGDTGAPAASPSQVFDIAYGAGTAMAVLGLVATVVAVRVVRTATAPVVVAAALVSLAAYVPGVISIANDATGAGPVVWRLAIAAPLWVFVGLLVAVPVPAPRRMSAPLSTATRTACLAAMMVVAVVIPLLAGHWLWSPSVSGRLASAPSWKVDQSALADVRAARRLHTSPGLWLMPKAQMEILAISTSGPYAVVPRDFYLPSRKSAPQELADRTLLLNLEQRKRIPGPQVQRVRDALERLHVSLACVPGDAPGARHLLSAAVGGHLQTVGTMRCHVPTP